MVLPAKQHESTIHLRRKRGKTFHKLRLAMKPAADYDRDRVIGHSGKEGSQCRIK